VPEFAFEAKALHDLEGRNDAALICFPLFSGSFAGSPRLIEARSRSFALDECRLK
jgi:hypothetical protein